MYGRRLALVAVVLGSGLLFAIPCHAQEQQLGQKVLGGLGLKAGAQPRAGLYVADRALFYNANQLVGRDGAFLPVGLDLDAFGNGLGVFAAIKLPILSAYLDVAVSVPVASVRINTQNPLASIDRSGLGDLYVQPFKLGWRFPHFDVVGGYAFYAPTGQARIGTTGVGRGHWTHELSLGGTVYFDKARTWHLSAISNYDINTRKQDIDLKRGSTFQIQGGAGKTLFRIVDVGVAAYTEWQTTDDSGSALPVALQGVRERTLGIGPEIDVLIPKLRTLVTFRYMHDLIVRARPKGQIFVVGLTVLAWKWE